MPILQTLTLHPVQPPVDDAGIASHYADDLLKHPTALSQHGHLKPVSRLAEGLAPVHPFEFG